MRGSSAHDGEEARGVVVGEQAAPGWSIGPAREGDEGRIAEIWRTGWGDGHLGNVPEALIRHRSDESFLPRARERLAKTRVARIGSNVVAFAIVNGNEVEQIYVDRAARGTGIAAAQLHDAESIIRAAGHRRAWLAVVEGNARARALYEREGWRDVGPFEYPAEASGQLLAVPTRRYERDLRAATSGFRSPA